MHQRDGVTPLVIEGIPVKVFVVIADDFQISKGADARGIPPRGRVKLK